MLLIQQGGYRRRHGGKWQFRSEHDHPMTRAHQRSRAGCIVVFLFICWPWLALSGTAPPAGAAVEETRPDQAVSAPDLPDLEEAVAASAADPVSATEASRGAEGSVDAGIGGDDQPWVLEEGAEQAYGAEDPLSHVSLVSLAAKLGLGLGFVILLAWGVVFVLKKSSVGRHLGSLGGTIRIVERTYLGPKKAVFLVQIGGRTLALGVTDSAISPLSEWREGELNLIDQKASATSFATQLKSILARPTQASARTEVVE